MMLLAEGGGWKESTTNAANSTLLDNNFVLIVTMSQHKLIFTKTIKEKKHNGI
jgi:hypothetical protein